MTTFEAWDAAGRTFDAVIAATAWHWVDPVAGAAKAAQVLRPGGRFAAFWNVSEPPPAVSEAFAMRWATVVVTATRLGSWPAQQYSGFLRRAARWSR